MEQMDKTPAAAAPAACAHGCGTGHDAASEQVQRTVAERGEPERAYVPAVDIIDSEKETVLVIDMPGAAEGSVDLTLEKNVLTIHAKPAMETYEGKSLIYSEYGVGDYRRSFSLSDEADRDGITASLKDGVLRVTLPKKAPVTKKITVGAS